MQIFVSIFCYGLCFVLFATRPPFFCHPFTFMNVTIFIEFFVERWKYLYSLNLLHIFIFCHPTYIFFSGTKSSRDYSLLYCTDKLYSQHYCCTSVYEVRVYIKGLF